MSDQKRSSGESFAGNVMKYSVATYLGFAITGLALIVKGPVSYTHLDVYKRQARTLPRD